MSKQTSARFAAVSSGGWVTFPGGELEGRPPKRMCGACRARARHDGTLCFQCYRVELDRERALRAAASLNTASEARFQSTLPFEPVNRPRLEQLRVERAAARTAMPASVDRFRDRQRRAQIAARHAIEQLASAAGFRARSTNPANPTNSKNPVNSMNPVNLLNPVNPFSNRFDSAIHAAMLQLPDSWLPFVLSR